MKFIDVLEEAKRLCGVRRVFSKDNTAFLVDGTIGFGDKHNIWYRDEDKKIHIFAKNISYENMMSVVRGLYDNHATKSSYNTNYMTPAFGAKTTARQMNLFENSSIPPAMPPLPNSEQDYGNYTFTEWNNYFGEK